MGSAEENNDQYDGTSVLLPVVAVEYISMMGNDFAPVAFYCFATVWLLVVVSLQYDTRSKLDVVSC